MEEPITRALRRVASRLRVNRALEDFSLAVCLLLAAVLAAQIVLRIAPVRLLPSAVPAVLFLAALGVWLAWRITRPIPLARAAAVADRRADLKDELTSAFWFLQHPSPTPWMRFQIERAALSASRLDAPRLVPTVRPRRIRPAAALLMMNAGVLALSLVLGESLRGSSRPEPSLSPEAEAQVRRVQALVQSSREKAEEDPGGPDPLQAAAAERLDRALRELNERELSLRETLEELDRADEALARAELGRGAVGEALEEMAQSLEGSEELAALREALRAFELEKASEALRELARKMAGGEAAAVPRDLLERLRGMSEGDLAALEGLSERFRESAEGLSEGDLADASRSLERAAQDLENLARRMEAQERLGEAGEELRQLMSSLAQQMPLDPSRAASAEGEGEDQGERSSGAAAGMLSSAGGAAWQLGPGNPEGSPDAGPLGPAGGSQPGAGEDRRGEPAETLEVQLQVEILRRRDRDTEARPEEIIEKESRRERSQLEYVNVPARDRYAEEDVLSPERIPWQYRRLVKSYFLTIQKSMENDRGNR